MFAVPDSLRDPIELAKGLWPRVRFYRQQREILRSIWRDDETYAVAGNMLGKDYVAGRAAIMFFLTRTPCRIFTTSVADDHLDVLWGEMKSAIEDSEVPLTSDKGGPLVVNHHHIRKLVDGTECPLSYIKGGTSPPNKGEKIQGHHIAQRGDGIPRTLFMADEASGLLQQYYEMATTWANRMFVFGNPWPCENFFKWAVKGRLGTADKGGNIQRDYGGGFHRWVTRIQATDSPNVQLALLQMARGETPTNEIIVHGVKPWSEYQKNLKIWPEAQQTVSLWADWYEGAEDKLYPLAWRQFSTTCYAKLKGKRRTAKSIGVDTGQGKANTSVAVVDEYGLMYLESRKLKNPKDVVRMVVRVATRFSVPWHKVFFDLGGGGHEYAGFMREMGYAVRTVAFGGGATKEREPGLKSFDEKTEEDDIKLGYTNKRTEMYGKLSERMDPARGSGFTIPNDRAEYAELHRQMAPIPRRYDSRGKLWLPPKYKHDPESNTQTIHDMIGCSPDELDATVLAEYGRTASDQWSTAGVG